MSIPIFLSKHYDYIFWEILLYTCFNIRGHSCNFFTLTFTMELLHFRDVEVLAERIIMDFLQCMETMVN